VTRTPGERFKDQDIECATEQSAVAIEHVDPSVLEGEDSEGRGKTEGGERRDCQTARLPKGATA